MVSFRSHLRLSSKLTKDDLVTFLPHLGDDSFTRVENTSESNLDILESSELLEDVFTRDTERAETLRTRIRRLVM